MKPRHAIPIVAVACLVGTSYAAFENNSKASMASDLQLLEEATKSEKREDREKSRLHFLEAIAKEAIVNKVPNVLFDDRGVLQRSHLPKLIKKDQSFNIGKGVTDGLVISSVGVRNERTEEYAAIAYFEGRLQIVQVYSAREIQNTINQIQQGAKS